MISLMAMCILQVVGRSTSQSSSSNTSSQRLASTPSPGFIPVYSCPLVPVSARMGPFIKYVTLEGDVEGQEFVTVCDGEGGYVL